MKTKSVLITQSNYIPWKGYFGGINLVDSFVVYDEMQYTTRDWRNRNIIKTKTGLSWLTIPVQVKGRYKQKIKDTKIADPNWNWKHWEKLKNTYKNAAHYNSVGPFIEELYANCDLQYLSEINLYFIRAINNLLDIQTEVISSSDFDLAKDKTQRLVDICKSLKATDYYTGPSAKNYMNERLFIDSDIAVHFFDFSSYKPYSQLYPPFVHGVSILDLLFNMGKKAKDYFKIEQ